MIQRRKCHLTDKALFRHSIMHGVKHRAQGVAKSILLVKADNPGTK